MPYDVAFSLGEADVAAYGIIFNKFEGAEFDFGRWEFKKPK
ncbi:hypothetical protein R5W24_000479 [Gemmata sp. JC717]|nr:hypothetical protein [Gemmata algarum]MDY3551403.1 hypothetical protein [Gemmata algarum]